MECEYCANYYNCESEPQSYCFRELRSVYDVLGDGLVFETTDLDETARARMNWFFKQSWGFEFKEIGKAFEVQLGNAIQKTAKTGDIIIEMARTVYRNRTNPNWHKAIKWTCFNLIDIETDVEITEEQVKAMFFILPECDAVITEINCEVDEDGEATLYVYIENGDVDNWLQETLEWCDKLTETGNEHSLSDENYDGLDVVIIYWGEFQ